MTRNTFLVPEYYPRFRCKIGDCRSSCCANWNVTVTLAEYYKLLGMDCPAELRRRLDGALVVEDNPLPERYALIGKNWEGDCVLHGADGRCMLQAACGEAAISSVCRCYPRGPRSRFGYEASMSASCERVTELLFEQSAPLRFIQTALEFELALPEPENGFLPDIYRPVRGAFIALLQNRDYPLWRRIAAMGGLADRLDAPAIAGDFAATQAALEENYFDKEPECGDNGLQTATELLKKFSGSRSLHGYAEKALANLDGSRAGYDAAAARFAARFPHWQPMFEQVLVNHIFYGQFPLGDSQQSSCAAYASFCALYALWRVTAVGCETADYEGLVDLTSSAFRMLEHSDFDRSAAALLRCLGRDDRVCSAALARV